MIKYIEEKLMFEMANISSNKTGLPVIVWVSEKRGNHGARIKVSNRYNNKFRIENTFSITISDNPEISGDIDEIKNKDIDLIKEWILLNKEMLLKYWNKEISTDILFDNLKSINGEIK